MVQRVDALETQLELNAFPQPGVLDDRQIQVVGAIRANAREPGTQRA